MAETAPSSSGHAGRLGEQWCDHHEPTGRARPRGAGPDHGLLSSC